MRNPRRVFRTELVVRARGRVTPRLTVPVPATERAGPCAITAIGEAAVTELRSVLAAEHRHRLPTTGTALTGLGGSPAGHRRLTSLDVTSGRPLRWSVAGIRPCSRHCRNNVSGGSTLAVITGHHPDLGDDAVPPPWQKPAVHDGYESV